VCVCVCVCKEITYRNSVDRYTAHCHLIGHSIIILRMSRNSWCATIATWNPAEKRETRVMFPPSRFTERATWRKKSSLQFAAVMILPYAERLSLENAVNLFNLSISKAQSIIAICFWNVYGVEHDSDIVAERCNAICRNFNLFRSQH